MSHPHRRTKLATATAMAAFALVVSGLAATTTTATGAVAARGAPAGNSCLAAADRGQPGAALQQGFAAASRTYGVPVRVLLGMSYMESRWDDHGNQMSTAGGYGPMNLTDVPSLGMGNAKGDGSKVTSDGPVSLHAARLAHRLTGLPTPLLTSDPAANVCGGAAVLAAYQRQLGRSVGAHTTVASWFHAVRRYDSSNDTVASARFATQVFETISHGEARTTNDGQVVRLAALPGLAVPGDAALRQATASATANSHIDCPSSLGCEWVPAPYAWYGSPNPYYYGNHDLANRPTDLHIDYIVIHDTETSYDTALQLVQDPEYLAWNYTIRSSDGHIAQHLDARDVGWHAGNWYVNMHSIGIEHEGYAAQGGSWYTEAMYQNSAALVSYLAHEYGVPLDRAHIIGHDQVPGIAPAYVAGMHWDPGPYWNWQHYMDLAGAPITKGTDHGSPKPGDVVTVAPGFAGNAQLVTGCDGTSTDPCPTQGTNFVYLHTAPSGSSPLVKDAGLHPDGSSSTTYVSDIGARVDAGQKLVVAARSGDWLSVWYLGDIGWLYAPKHQSPVLRDSSGSGATVSARPGADAVPVYGRAYPEASAYPSEIPVQGVYPLQYSIKAGQRYALADANIQTDYYYAQTFDDSVPMDHTDVVGKDRYYEIWFGHRMAYVRAADVTVSRH